MAEIEQKNIINEAFENGRCATLSQIYLRTINYLKTEDTNIFTIFPKYHVRY